jgi:hypothetical protein
LIREADHDDVVAATVGLRDAASEGSGDALGPVGVLDDHLSGQE